MAKDSGRRIVVSKMEASSSKTKLAAAVELGRRGGLKGGKARAAVLSAEQRSAIAKNAAEARWKKAKRKKS